jgi:hypothetical protein
MSGDLITLDDYDCDCSYGHGYDSDDDGHIGSYHARREQMDLARDEFLQALGYDSTNYSLTDEE